MFSFVAPYPVVIQQTEFVEACEFEVPWPLLLQTGQDIDVGEKLREQIHSFPISWEGNPSGASSGIVRF